MLVTLLGNLYGITLGFDVVAKLESLYESFHGINGGKINALFLRESLEYTDGKVIGSDEGIELGSMDGKVLGTILGNVNVITLATYVVTKFVSLNGFFDGSNDKNLESKLLGESLAFADGKILGYDEGIKLGSTDGIVFVSILGNAEGIVLVFVVGTDMEYLDVSLMVLMMGSLKAYCLVTNSDLMMVKCLDLTKA